MAKKSSDGVAMTPAALVALANGELGNALAAMLPGGIEAQEAAGQRDLTARAERLPVQGTIDSPEKRKQWEAVGFVFAEPAPQSNRDVFVACTFPKGWVLKPTDHSMWSHVVDDKGRKRASVFYKAAFYDVSAHTGGLECRYTVGSEYLKGEDRKRRYRVLDNATGKTLHKETDKDPAKFFEESEAEKAANAWLAEHFPDHANPLAYWD